MGGEADTQAGGTGGLNELVDLRGLVARLPGQWAGQDQVGVAEVSWGAVGVP